jgi:hypothetical protein
MFSFLDTSKISKAVFDGLAKKIRDNADALKNPTFADATTSKTAVKTQDLHLDVHRNTQDPSRATAIIQASSEATDRTSKITSRRRPLVTKGFTRSLGRRPSSD